jgi:hypothetical protein
MIIDNFMIKIYPADSRYSFDKGWLRANFSFSFGEYDDPVMFRSWS